jgi:hypothetical protein
MRRWRRRAETLARPPWLVQGHHAGIEFAWRVHAAQETWTAKVDGKAAIVLSLETAVLAALFAVQSPNLLLGRLVGWRSIIADIGVAFHITAVAFAAAAVIPLLGPCARHKAEHGNNAIYFGHLRYWNDERLAHWLAKLRPDEELKQLSRQLVELSRRNWRKHRYLQLSMLAALTGSVLIGVGVLAPHGW